MTERCATAVTATVATVIFDRPAARNAMTWRMYEQLGEACARIRGRTGCASRCFAAPAARPSSPAPTSRSSRPSDSGEDGIAYEEKMEDYIGGVEALPVPTLAVVEGLRHRRRARHRGGVRSAHRHAGLALRRSDRAHAGQLPVDCELRAAGGGARAPRAPSACCCWRRTFQPRRRWRGDFSARSWSRQTSTGASPN